VPYFICLSQPSQAVNTATRSFDLGEGSSFPWKTPHRESWFLSTCQVVRVAIARIITRQCPQCCLPVDPVLPVIWQREIERCRYATLLLANLLQPGCKRLHLQALPDLCHVAARESQSKDSEGALASAAKKRTDRGRTIGFGSDIGLNWNRTKYGKWPRFKNSTTRTAEIPRRGSLRWHQGRPDARVTCAVTQGPHRAPNLSSQLVLILG
jgi:hypothetical protein